MQAYRQTGVKPPGLDGPPCPPGMDYLWSWFCELSNRRTRGMSASPLTWADFDGWQRLRRIALTAFEFECLAALDHEFLTEKKPHDRS